MRRRPPDNGIPRYGFTVTGVDISEEAINAARSNAASSAIKFVVASLEEDLPFEDGIFMWIWCSEVLEHVLDVGAVVARRGRL